MYRFVIMNNITIDYKQLSHEFVKVARSLEQKAIRRQWGNRCTHTHTHRAHLTLLLTITIHKNYFTG